MIERLLGRRPALWPTLFTIPALAVLLFLAGWQVQRLMWKRDLIATIEARVHAAPVPLPAEPIDPQAWRYRRVELNGAYVPGAEVHLIAFSTSDRQGYQVIAPFRRADTGGIVLVNRGWIPQDKRDPKDHDGLSDAPVRLSGLVMVPFGRGWLQPDNEPARNLWFFPDLAAMKQALHAEGAPNYWIELDTGADRQALPRGGQSIIDIPNNHLGYALTWFSFAGMLIVIYVMWHRNSAKTDKIGTKK